MPRRSERGSAVLIVITLLSLMAALMVSNTVALRRLKVGLQLLEQKQQRQLKALADGRTNQPPARVVP